MKKILVTGASGFIGSFVVEEALKRGFETWAAVRKGSSKRYLQDGRIRFIELDLDDPDGLRGRLAGIGFDYVVHAAGATKCLDAADFFRINTQGTKNLAAAVADTCPELKRFVFISSLSVLGPVREAAPYTDMTAADTPRPDTAYGRSKLEAERALDGMQGFPFIVLRPTGVYGPREKDYFMMAESIKKHVDFAAGLRPQDLTFIYVKDLVRAVFLALERGNIGSRYLLSDGRVYSSRAFSDLIRRELGNPWLLRIKAPLWLLRVITAAGEGVGRLTGRLTALNNDKYKIMRQRNWRCDIRPAVAELGFSPRYGLAEGVHEAVEWYKENKWL
ncbi:MAG TPA: NAD(P)-dependent oxidoreductase [Candidatus Prevotella stercoripullorum]|nr:NAD(P)-dependent oxidoreductase [Candidatus Prevotella stercoripullorum]